jgi:hypothetical protein
MYLGRMLGVANPQNLLDQLGIESSVLRLIGEIRYNTKNNIEHMLVGSKLRFVKVT